MIWRSSLNSKIAQLADIATVILGFIISYTIWDYLHIIKPNQIPVPIQINLNIIFLVISVSIFYMILFDNYKAYSYQRFSSLLTEYNNIFKVSIVVLMSSVFISYLFINYRLPRTALLLPFVIIMFLLILEKSLLYLTANFVRQRGKNRKRIILIGTGTRANKFIETVNKNFSWGLDILGLLTGDNKKIGKLIYGHKVLDSYYNISRVIKDFNPEEIIITISTKRFDELREVLEICENVGVPVRLNSDFFGKITKNVKVDTLYGLNIISFNFVYQKEWQLLIKRIFDIIFSFVSIIILFPLLIFICFLIFIQDGSPILYSWKIVGQNRKFIKSWKFRTMVRNADELKKDLESKNEMSGPMFKLTDDPRIIPIGRFLRKFSFDELPQLFSVLKGDLSLVGPRPPLQYEFNEFDLWHRRKLSVKPGITCLWQVSGRNNINNFDDWAKLDLEYIDNWSLLLDFKILLKTIPAVLMGKGAK